MDREKEMNTEVFNEEAPQAPEFALDEENPLKWADEVEQKLPEFDMSEWGEAVKEDIPEEPTAYNQQQNPHGGWEAQHQQQYGKQGGWENQSSQAYGPQYSGQQQYGQQPYGQPYGQPYAQGPYGQPVGPIGEKNKLVAGLLAIFLGGLGIHKFYMGLNQQGIIMLIGTFVGALACGIGPIVTGVISLIEGIMYLTQTDQSFYEIYEVGKKPWF